MGAVFGDAVSGGFSGVSSGFGGVSAAFVSGGAASGRGASATGTGFSCARRAALSLLALSSGDSGHNHSANNTAPIAIGTISNQAGIRHRLALCAGGDRFAASCAAPSKRPGDAPRLSRSFNILLMTLIGCVP